MSLPKIAAPLLALTLAAAGVSGPALAFDITKMTPAESAAFGTQVRDYLVKNPEVMLDVMSALEAKQAQQQAQSDSDIIAANDAQIFKDPASWVGGNPDGDITVVEFLDYRCGYCRKAHSEVQELVKSDGNIRYVVKEFPILGPDSITASRFAIGVLQTAGPEAYEKLKNAFYTSFRGEMTVDNLKALGTSLGFDPAPAVARMNAPEVEAVIKANHELAGKLQIQGTPTFVLGDQMLRGYLPLDGMRQVVAEVRG
ncbi:DsbA family protein [Frigidibacter sp. MR17.14]|uniref:DsbA family protein n=1 Tax=Frigidibacter sp. MR17.14 TaxID=3126509 RepID=UPI003013007C